MLTIPNGMGTWLAVFDHRGDVAGSISQRPNLMPILDVLEESGDEIFENADSVVIEVDMDIFDSSSISPIRDINIFRKPLDIHKYCTNYYNSIFIYCHIFQLPFYRFLIGSLFADFINSLVITFFINIL